MIFLDYWTIGLTAGLGLALAAGVLLFRKVRASRPLVKIPSRIFSALLILSSAGLLFMFGCANAWNVSSHSMPLYSPDQRKALRVEDVDSGAFGGYTSITLYTNHGLLARNIFAGQWKQAEAKTVRWISNTEISIKYDDSYPAPPEFKSINEVSVKCEPVTYKYPH